MSELTGYPSIDKPWLKYYSEEAINAPLPECSIYEYMYENNKDYPSDIAINYMGRKITYGELFESIDKTAAAFIKAGVKEKEIVTVALPSIPEALYCVYALNKIGAVANMIHPLAGKEETLNYLNEVKSRVTVIFDGAYTTIADDIEKTSVELVIVASPSDSLPLALKIAYNLKARKTQLGRRFVSWKSFIQHGCGITVSPVKRDCHEMAIISHTGGTTGEPKGCMLSDYNVNSEIWQIIKSMSNTRQETMMAVLPPFINYSLVNCMLEPVYAGLITVLIPKYEPSEFAEYIKKYKVNHVNSIPPYWEALIKIPNIEKNDFSKLRFLFYGGESMPKETEEEVNRLLHQCGTRINLQKGLGMTEITSAATATYEEINEAGSVGIPLVKMGCKIIDRYTLKEEECLNEGEICFSGPTLMLGYYDNPEATDEIIKIHEDGNRWIHTGDLGYINEDGVIFVTGRIKRIIMTKGNDGQATKLFPDRIEKAIYSNSAVDLSCVIGVPHETRIYYPKAFVVLKEGIPQSDDVKQSIINGCKELLPDYMIPEEIEFRTDLPRTSRGKVDYRALEQEIDNKTPLR